MQTNDWLDDHFNEPESICKLIKADLADPSDFYRYLQKFGMYRPTKGAQSAFERLKKEEIWSRINKLYNEYRKKWDGPEVDVYIFPIDETNRFFINRNQGKSGLAFKDKIFLFVSPALEDQVVEALWVHEYHHAARMSVYNKKMSEYNLLDSLVFEGLAEVAVLNYCGKKYIAPWTKAYRMEQLRHFWKQVYEKQLRIQRKDPLHDQLLFGQRGIPVMMGYAIGYELVKGYIQNHRLSLKETLRMPSTQFLKGSRFLNKNE